MGKQVALNLRVSEEEKAQYDAAAARSSQPLSKWVRAVLGAASSEDGEVPSEVMGLPVEVDPSVPAMKPGDIEVNPGGLDAIAERILSRPSHEPYPSSPRALTPAQLAVREHLAGRGQEWKHRDGWCKDCTRKGAPTCEACMKLEGVSRE